MYQCTHKVSERQKNEKICDLDHEKFTKKINLEKQSRNNELG